MKYGLIIFLLLLFTNTPLLTQENMISTILLLDEIGIDTRLENKIPLFQQDNINNPQAYFQENNMFTLIFSPAETEFSYFSKVTGRSIFKAQFLVSWYIFTNESQIPTTTRKTLDLVNLKKPDLLSSLIFVNGQWETIVDLPYYAEKKGSYIYAYVSYPNKKGVLVPVSGQSFYKDSIVGQAKRVQVSQMNGEILRYWKKVGYL